MNSSVSLVGVLIASSCCLLANKSHAFTIIQSTSTSPLIDTTRITSFQRTVIHDHDSKRNKASTSLFQSSRATTPDEVVINPLDKFVAFNSIWDVLDASTLAPTIARDVQEQQQQQSKLASMPNLMISLSKQVIGGGILALPASVATIGNAANHGEHVIPMACGMIAIMGLINAYFFSLCGRVCHMTGATSFKQAWEKTVGPESSQLVAATLAMKTTLSCIAYAVILGDSFASLANSAGIVDHIVTRPEALQVIGLTFLLPMCLQRDLSSLAPFSLAGLAMILFTASTVVVRAFDGSYAIESGGGQFVHDITLQPAFDTAATAAATTLDNTGFFPELQGMALLGCTLISTFVAHYNAPRFHSELENNTPERFNTVTGASYAIATAVFMAVATAGYMTFGSSTLPFILNNYSPSDTLIALGNALVAVSICLTFPLPFVGLRDGCFDAMLIPTEQRTSTMSAAASVALLSLVVTLASHVSDLGAVLSIGGGTFSTAVAAVFPALMFHAAVQKNYGGNEKNESLISNADQGTTKPSILPKRIGFDIPNLNQIESNVALGLMSICVALGGTGVTIALNNVFS